jgi:tripartite-type tricarboxylate transporter receptor subunit TctC
MAARSIARIVARTVVAAGLVSCCSLPVLAAGPRDYPTRPVRVIVAFAAGGFADTNARVIGQKLSEQLGQHFVIDNRGGAGGSIAARTVAEAAPDGYTLLVHTAASGINATLAATPGFDLLRDLAPVANTVSTPGLWIVLSTHPASNLQDLIRMSKGKRLNYATAGVGTSSHIAGDYLLRVLAGLDAVHVPFKGGAPALAAILGNQVEILSGSGTAALPLIKQGRLKSLGVSSPQRLTALPDVPTVSESGFPGFVERSWVGFFAPARTPAAIVTALNREINQALAHPDVKSRFLAQGMELHPGSVADFARHVRTEVAMWAKIIKTTGVKAE